jgi:hypothetical protein
MMLHEFRVHSRAGIGKGVGLIRFNFHRMRGRPCGSLQSMACVGLLVLRSVSPLHAAAAVAEGDHGSIKTVPALHWAFQPPKEPTIPSVKLASWPWSPIDCFILAQLEKVGLRPSPPAGRRALLRRATYDLIGLPPTPEEVDAFLLDKSPDAFSRVVDRLLASPRYGERWGRHWLDVARYSDTKGYVYDRDEKQFVHAYTYRDWVIGAFNDDLPYDQFLVQQIAGDLLPGPGAGEAGGRTSPLAAMGFLTLGRRFLGVQHDIIDDRIDVLMRGMLGLTVACARCHYHKSDPITMRDYYSLYGVFNSSRERVVPLVNHPEPTRAYE